MGKIKQVFIDIDKGEFVELQKNDELVGSEVPTEPTVSALRSRVGYYRNQVIFLLGETSPGDNQGKNVFWNPDSTDPDDGDIVFKPDAIDASDPGRWIAYFDAYTRTEANNKFTITYKESNDNEITL